MPRSKVGKALTKVRGPVHGNFAEGATITQGVLALFQGGSSWGRMSAAKKEALHMIVHKMHRIVTGNPDHKDHWDDIGGYGQLGADDCVAAAPIRRKYKKRAKVSLPRAQKEKTKSVARAARKVGRPPVVKKRRGRPAKKAILAAPLRTRQGRPVLNGAAGNA